MNTIVYVTRLYHPNSKAKYEQVRQYPILKINKQKKNKNNKGFGNRKINRKVYFWDIF